MAAAVVADRSTDGFRKVADIGDYLFDFFTVELRIAFNGFAKVIYIGLMMFWYFK